MNNFEKGLLYYFKHEDLEKIQKVKVGIAGCGGLGSNCAFNLVRCGFKQFKIVDFDMVDYGNLNRQFYFLNQVGKDKVEALKDNLIAINPELNIEMKKLRIDKDNIKTIFSDCDIIVEAFDNPVYKKMIAEEYGSSDKFVVSASGLAGWGKSGRIKVHRINSRFYIVGDLSTEVSEECPPVSPMVNIAAAKQADLVLSYVLGENAVVGYE